MTRLYQYVGSKRIAARALPEHAGIIIRSPQDVLAWARKTDREARGNRVIATFVVDSAGELLIADRRSEHVVCAGGRPVKSAGEITFDIGSGVEVVAVSNQSTGYCPEPESWPEVADALLTAKLKPPTGFELRCEFRRCPKCDGLNLVKDCIFECGMCGDELPLKYNVADS